MNFFIKRAKILAMLCASMFFLPFIIIAALFARAFSRKCGKPRLVWGSAPIINNSYWSRAMRAAGYSSETYTTYFFDSINKRSDWDRVLSDEFKLVPTRLRIFIAFIVSLFRYDVYFIPFSGYFLGSTPLRFFQAQILKIAGKKIVLIPFGSDSYVYRNIRSVHTLHGLLLSYPAAGRMQNKIEADVEYWVRFADAVIPGFMGPDGFGRWDVLIPSQFMIDLDQWTVSKRNSFADGLSDEVVVAHAPNHRGFKGTEFVINAIEQLRSKGLKVRLLLLEGVQNDEVRRILTEEVDILAEQLIYTGHGMNALEGMACGLPTVCNLEDSTYTLPVRRWSYFEECPLVSASPESLMSVLSELIQKPELRRELGVASRAYVEKYHGLDSAHFLFSNVIEYIYGRRGTLHDLYHPILGVYPNREPKIRHPLKNNQLVT